MSLTIKIEIPLSAVQAIQGAAKGSEAISQRYARELASQAVVDAIKDLPYDLTPKGINITTKQAEMTIYIQRNDGSINELSVRGTYTIDQVKGILHEKTDIPADEQRLLFAGKQLEDGRTLNDVSLQHNLEHELRSLICFAVQHQGLIRSLHGPPSSWLLGS